MVQRSIGMFLLILVLSYVLVAMLFAALYMYNISDCVTQSNKDGVVTMSDSFYDAFFFSVQTLSTVGYGSRSPTCVWSEVVSAIECICGLIYVALITGLLFGRCVPVVTLLFL